MAFVVSLHEEKAKGVKVHFLEKYIFKLKYSKI